MRPAVEKIWGSDPAPPCEVTGSPTGLCMLGNRRKTAQKIVYFILFSCTISIFPDYSSLQEKIRAASRCCVVVYLLSDLCKTHLFQNWQNHSLPRFNLPNVIKLPHPSLDTEKSPEVLIFTDAVARLHPVLESASILILAPRSTSWATWGRFLNLSESQFLHGAQR